MRIFSTEVSVSEREVSILAILETLGAIVFAAWLVFSRGHWSYIAVAACTAPLLLLRTERSSALARKLWEFWLEMTIFRLENFFIYFEPQQENSRLKYRIHLVLLGLAAVFYLLVLPAVALMIIRFIFGYLSATACKFIAIIHSVFFHLFEIVCCIPKNWATLLFCIDFAHTPEMVPGIEKHKAHLPAANRFTFGFFHSIIAEMDSEAPRSDVQEGFFLIISFFTFLPAWFYRFALKSTAIVWLPLIWISHVTCDPKPLRSRLKIICKDSLGRFVFWLSVFILLLLLSKLYLYNFVSQYERIMSGWPFFSSLTKYVDLYQLPWWQVGAGINSGLAIFLYLYAGRQLLLLEDGALNDTHMKYIDMVLRSTTFIRAILSVYTSTSLLYLIGLESIQWTLPPLGEKLFPWSK